MALRTRGIVTQIAKETTFNTAPTFSDSDVVLAISTAINPKVDMVDRKELGCSLVKKAGIPVRFTTDGNVEVEMRRAEGDNPTFVGDVLFEAGLGVKHLADGDKGNGGFIGYESDGETEADKVSLADSDHAGTATIYTIGDTGVERISLALKKFYDSGDVVLTSTGNVINKVDMQFPTADILTATFSLEGSGYSTSSGETKPACPSDTKAPLVGKSATFKFGGNVVNATDLSVSITNKITNEESLTGSGYTNKYIVEKEVTGSFKVLMEDFSYLDKLTNQTIGEFYLQITNGTDELGLYMPKVKVTEVSVTDNSNMLIEVSVTFQAERDDSLGETLLLGIK